MECAPVRAQVWLDAHEHELGDLRIPDVVALIESAGLHARVIRATSDAMGQEQHGDRVSLWLTGAGELSSVEAG